MRKTHVATGFFVYFLARYFGFLLSSKALSRIEPKVYSGVNDADFINEDQGNNLQVRILGRNTREDSRVE